MALNDFEMHEYLRLSALAKWQAEHPLEFNENQISSETGHTDTLELNLLQAEALTGSFKVRCTAACCLCMSLVFCTRAARGSDFCSAATQGHKPSIDKQRHPVSITIPKALRPLLRSTLTPGALTRISRGRGEEAPAHLWAPPPEKETKKKKKKKKRK